MYVVGLRKDRDRLIYQALAPSTRKVYAKHVEKFREFCGTLGTTMRQGLRGETVELWLTQLRRRGAAYGTVRSHLAAVRQYCLQYQVKARLDTPRITLILKGIKKEQGQGKTVKNVITLSHLHRLTVAAAKIYGKGFQQRRFSSMASLAFFAFLRPSEYCISAAGHELRWRDVKFERKLRSIRIVMRSYKHSQGEKMIRVGATGGSCCPVKLLWKYKKVCDSRGSRPVFRMETRQFRCQLDRLMEVAKIKTHLTPHCFRHGGATWASNNGWTDARIKAHGRWKSDAYKLYVRPF